MIQSQCLNGSMVQWLVGFSGCTCLHPLSGVPKRKGWAPGGKGISGRAKELLDAHGLANASLTCGKPKRVVSKAPLGESQEF